MIAESPRSVYARVRPRRIAFFVDPDQCPSELLDDIVDATLRLWGGRCNPIIPIVGGTVSPAYWQLLRFADPDLIYTYTDVPAPLLARIDREICPLEIRPHPPAWLGDPNPNYRPANLGTGFPEWLPWLPNAIRREPFPEKVRVLLSEAHGDWAPRRFVLRNLGLLGVTAPLWNYLDPQQVVPARATDKEATLLHAVSALGLRLFFPHDLAAYFSDIDEPEAPSHAYALVLGNDMWGQLFAWNRVLHLPPYRRLRWHTMWVPPGLLSASDFVAALNAFLSRYVIADGNTPPLLEVWYSHPVGSVASAQSLLGPVLQHVHCIPQYSALSPHIYPPVNPREDRFGAFERVGLLERFRPVPFQLQVPARNFLVHIPETAAPRPIGGRRATAMLDVKIEHLPEDSGERGRRQWWRLPKLLGITRGFGSIGRVGTDGMLSFLLEDESALELTVPEPLDVVGHVLVGPRNTTYRGDPRPEVTMPYYRCEPSDKGQYYRGIATLFGGLEAAGRFYQHHFWREILEWASGRSREEDSRPIRAIAGRLQAIQPLLAQAGAGDTAALEDLARFVLAEAAQQRLQDRDLTFKDFHDRMNKEFEAYSKAHPDRRKPLRETEELVRSLEVLTQAAVFFQGTRLQCPHCLSTFWYAAGDLDQYVQCQGCRGRIPLQVRAVWSYRLNPLVRNGVALHGAGPVLAAIADLSQRARSFFVVDPGVWLYERDNEQPVADLDIAAIVDGRIAIGEVKNRAAAFTDERLRALAEAARRIGAHIVILAAFADEGGVLGRHAATLREFIGDAAVTVEALLPHPQQIEPRPYLGW